VVDVSINNWKYNNTTLRFNIYLRHKNLQRKRCEEKEQIKNRKRYTNQSKTTVEEDSQTCNSGSFKAEDGGVNLGSVDK
jgi:hypothetical protein